nr:hypothetical protein CFP56_56579 [Quercus suber]
MASFRPKTPRVQLYYSIAHKIFSSQGMLEAFKAPPLLPGVLEHRSGHDLFFPKGFGEFANIPQQLGVLKDLVWTFGGGGMDVVALARDDAVTLFKDPAGYSVHPAVLGVRVPKHNRACARPEVKLGHLLRAIRSQDLEAEDIFKAIYMEISDDVVEEIGPDI